MSNKQKPKTKHHHVWQKYLKQWEVDEGGVFRLQGNRIFSSGTPAIAVEKYFYKIPRLKKSDIDFLRYIFDPKGNGMNPANEHLLKVLTESLEMIKRMEGFFPSHEIDQIIDHYLSEVLENHHEDIEESFIPLLQKALDGDISFYKDKYDCIPFLNFLSTQYMRTVGIKNRAIESVEYNYKLNIERLWNVMIHMHATNIGASLYRQRENRKLTLIQNKIENCQFVTGDQPAINLKATSDHKPPDKLVIYYPISPNLALLLSEVDEEPEITSCNLSKDNVFMLNKKMQENSYREVFAQSEDTLKALRDG